MIISLFFNLNLHKKLTPITRTADVKDVANAFLKLSEPESGDGLTNLKLQKLLYYVHGFNLALNNEPMFDAEIKAWEHGPVVPEIYHLFKDHGANIIPIDYDVELASLSKQNKSLISEVNKVYGQFSGWKLRDMTHKESPWKETNLNAEITHKKLRKFFKTLV